MVGNNTETDPILMSTRKNALTTQRSTISLNDASEKLENHVHQGELRYSFFLDFGCLAQTLPETHIPLTCVGKGADVLKV